MRFSLAHLLPIVASGASLAVAAEVDVRANLNWPGQGHIRRFAFSVDNQPVQLTPKLRLLKTVVNGQFPGPLVRVPYNDAVEVPVWNKLKANGTSIHWHGLHQQGTPYYDGFASQNQCPIPPSQSFTYQFRALDSGTSFYHAHFADQNADGLFGAVVIEDAPGSFPFHYDEERVLLLTDAWNATSWELTSILESPGGASGPHLDPTPDWGFACIYDDWGEASCSADSTGEGFELEFEPGKTYRLRIVAASNLAPFVFSIDGHEMQVVKSDLGTLDGNTVVTRLPMMTGQRYDVLVKAKSHVSDGDSFWVRSELQSTCWPVQTNLTTDVRGILRYRGSNNKPPTSTAWTNTTDSFVPCGDLPNSYLAPLNATAISPSPEATLMVNYSLVLDTATNVVTSIVNGMQYNLSATSEPSTLLAYHNNPAYFAPGSNIFTLPDSLNGGQVRIILNGQGAPGAHPFHLHGHSFYILASGPGEFNSSVPLNLKNPPMRDSLAVPATGYAVLQFDANNAGVWALHCHIGFHLMEGMLGQIVEFPGAIANMSIPSQVSSQCQYSGIL